MESVDHGVGRRGGWFLSSVPSDFGNAGTQQNRAPVLPPDSLRRHVRIYGTACPARMRCL